MSADVEAKEAVAPPRGGMRVSRVARERRSPCARGLRKLIAAGTSLFRRVRGVERGARKVDSMLRSLDAGSFRCVVGGASFIVDTEDLIDFRLAYLGGHDSHVVRFIAGALPENGVLWDVGANVGSVSLVVAAIRVDVRIFSFEPSPLVERRFRRNLKANRDLRTRISVVPVALSDRTARVGFFPSAESANSGVGSLYQAHNTQRASVPIDAFTADEWLKRSRSPAPDVVKLDVEGYEVEALRGMAGILKHCRPVVVMEHEPYRLKERGLHMDAALQLLRAAGYQIRVLDRAGRERCWNDRMANRHVDIAALPPDPSSAHVGITGPPDA